MCFDYSLLHVCDGIDDPTASGTLFAEIPEMDPDHPILEYQPGVL